MNEDILLQGGLVVTLDNQNRFFVGDVLLHDGRIQALGPTGSVVAPAHARIVSARGCIVAPGFVQAHVHLCQVLFRGLAEDVALLDWLEQFIWPLEGAHDEQSLYASARLGIAELLLGGTTSALDMGTVQHTDVIFQAAQESGFRLTTGKAMMDHGRGRSGGLRETTDESLSASKALAKKWHNSDDGLLRYAYAPRFILSCSEQLLRQTAKDARDLGCRIHTHASENPGEVDVVREVYGTENILALHNLGITGDDVVIAHCVHLTSKEQKVLVDTGTHIAHCPSTNLKLASGVAHIPELLEQGASIGIGADGAPCNNRLSQMREMSLAGLLQKPRLGPDAFSAQTIVELATIGGARALGIADRVGSLEVGKDADIIVVDCRRPHTRPLHDPFTTLVYGAEGGDIRDVFVRGRWVVQNKQLATFDLDKAMQDAEQQVESVLERSGVEPRYRW